MTTGTEFEQDRDKRHHQRTLFDAIAERYEQSRPTYPPPVTDFIAAFVPGATTLEIDCGTGQLAEEPAGKVVWCELGAAGSAQQALLRRLRDCLRNL